MIHSKYFPAIEACISDNQRGEDKIEIPTDVYDVAVDEKNFLDGKFIRGEYDYETAKIFAESGLVDALKFYKTSGEIKTESTAGISAEIMFALAIWDGYDRETAIERVILSGMKKFSLQKLLSEKISQIDTARNSNVEKDIAKYLAGKSSGYVEGKIKTVKAASEGVSVNLPKVPQVLHNVGDKLGDVVSFLGDQVVYVFRYGESFLDWAKGRISGKQLAKNTTVATIAASGASLGYSVGGAVAATFGLPAVIGVGTALAAGYAFKVFYKKATKKRLDLVFSDDSENMKKIILDELITSLEGKFLTQYEMEILLETICDTVTNEKLKEMYQNGNSSAQKEWAQDFVERCLQNIHGSRIFVKMPSPAEWQVGLQRVNEILNSGENINELMERRRAESVQKKNEIISRYNLKAYEIAQAMSIINPIVKAQVGIERVLTRMQTGEENFQSEKKRLLKERAALKAKAKR